MTGLKRDFGFMGRLFGVPRAWLSRVGAFCSSWCVDGNLLKLTVPDVPDPASNPVKIGVDEDALTDFVDDAVDSALKNSGASDPDATECPLPEAGDTGYITDSDSSDWPSGMTASGILDATTWTRGTTADASGNLTGVKIAVIDGIMQAGNSNYFLVRTLEFDSNGLLKSVSAETGAFKGVAKI